MKNKTLITLSGIAATALCILAMRAYASGCFECPGENLQISPSPPCQQGISTPKLPGQDGQCDLYLIDQIGYGFGPCVSCYEPSYKKCDETNPGNLTFSEYMGQCVGTYECEPIPGRAPIYRQLPLSNSAQLSHDAGYCDHT